MKFKNKVLEKITGLADKAITDKDKRNEFIFHISQIIASSEVGRWVRAILSVLTVFSCFFFADKMTIDAETQKYLLYMVFGFYFLDYLKKTISR